MPIRRIIFHRLATKEFRSARRYYAQQAPGTTERFRAAVKESLERVVDHPEFLPPIDATYRRVRVNRFPFSLVFRELSDDLILIVAVQHASRKPGYWSRRK